MPIDQLGLPTDPHGFVRRQCPHCRRQFKTRPAPTDGVGVQRYLGRVLEHHNVQECLTRAAWRCFYCGKAAPVEEWLTPEQQVHVERAGRALATQIRFEQLAHIPRTLSVNPNLGYLPLAPTPLPPPLAGEADDMRAFFLVCCGEDVKAATGWDQAYHCPRCGTEHMDGLPRVKQQLQFIRE